jgi:large subunit ribosomal protein L12
VGITPDDAKVKALVASLEGQNIDELIKQAAVAVAAPAEVKKEEKKVDEEKKEETAAAGLSQLFG